MFQAFSRIIREGGSKFVVMDTAPTGHTLLLLDATGAYHREVARQIGDGAMQFRTPMMQLQDPARTKVLLVTLAETTPVLEAAGLQADLRTRRHPSMGMGRQSESCGRRHPLAVALAAGARRTCADRSRGQGSFPPLCAGRAAGQRASRRGPASRARRGSTPGIGHHRISAPRNDQADRSCRCPIACAVLRGPRPGRRASQICPASCSITANGGAVPQPATLQPGFPVSGCSPSAIHEPTSV